MNEPAEIPPALVVVRRRVTPELVWAVPILAALIGVWLAVQAVRGRGPTVTISLRDGRGIVTGKTKVKYRDVDVGTVNNVGFGRDRSQVIVTAELSRDAGAWMVEDTRFWIVEPRVSSRSTSGRRPRCGASSKR